MAKINVLSVVDRAIEKKKRAGHDTPPPVETPAAPQSDTPVLLTSETIPHKSSYDYWTDANGQVHKDVLSKDGKTPWLSHIDGVALMAWGRDGRLTGTSLEDYNYMVFTGITPTTNVLFECGLPLPKDAAMQAAYMALNATLIATAYLDVQTMAPTVYRQMQGIAVKTEAAASKGDIDGYTQYLDTMKGLYLSAITQVNSSYGVVWSEDKTIFDIMSEIERA